MRRLRRKLVEYYRVGEAVPIPWSSRSRKAAMSRVSKHPTPWRTRLGGESLGPYQVIERLGVGPSGITYRVVEPTTGNEFAAKQLCADISSKSAAVDALRADVKAAAILQSENACSVEAVEETSAGVLAPLEVPRRRHSRGAVALAGLSWPESKAIAGQLLSVLSTAHKSGVVHGRLKPSDVLLSTIERRDRCDGSQLRYATARRAHPAQTRRTATRNSRLLTVSCRGRPGQRCSVRGQYSASSSRVRFPLFKGSLAPPAFPFVPDVPEQGRCAACGSDRTWSRRRRA